MKTTDLFKTSAKKLNESLGKTFGQKLNLESFDTEKLEDARNKLRTQIHQVRSESGFNEAIENEALTKAQWMLDSINAEIAERSEHIVDPEVNEGAGDQEVMNAFQSAAEQLSDIGGYGDPDMKKVMALVTAGKVEDAADEFVGEFTDKDGGEVRGADGVYTDLVQDLMYATGAAGVEPGESIEMEVAPPGDKAERMIKHIKKGYANDGKLTDKERSIAYATAWKQHNKEKNESIEQGEDMRNLKEGEIQQASAIVTAKTMVDRVGRWIEELSGMENDTLLTLGDSIRDEMGQEAAKQFISTVAPVIQSALENLKQARETLSGGVRALTGEEQPAEMLGAETPDMGGEEEMAGEAEPDAMNAGDEFAAAEPAAGGAEEAGRAQRESIDRGARLLKVLAG